MEAHDLQFLEKFLFLHWLYSSCEVVQQSESKGFSVYIVVFYDMPVFSV
jgi:hypothetical protein